MNSFFRNLIIMNISGSLIFIFFLILKFFIRNIVSKKTQYIIMILILLRFIIPFSFEINSDKNIPIIKETLPIANEFVKIVENLEDKNILEINHNSENSTTEKTYNEIVEKFFKFKHLVYIYIITSILILTYYIFNYVRFNKILNNNLICEDDLLEKNLITIKKALNVNRKISIYRSKFISTPILIGILKPKIIIPNYISNEKQIKNILFHELYHFKQNDLEIKWLITIAISINFFNPLIYFIKNEINKACELSCDENVIKFMNLTEKKDYGNTLIDIMELNSFKKNSGFIMMCEEKKNIKERLVSIMKFKPKNRFVSIISLTLILSFIFLGIIVSGNSELDEFSQNIKKVAEMKTSSKWYSFNKILLEQEFLPKEILERAAKLEDGNSADFFLWSDIYRGANEYKIGFFIKLRDDELLEYNYTNMGKGFAEPYNPINNETGIIKIISFLKTFKSDNVIDNYNFNNSDFKKVSEINKNPNYKIESYKIYIDDKHNYEFTIDLNMGGIIKFKDFYIEKLSEKDVAFNGLNDLRIPQPLRRWVHS